MSRLFSVWGFNYYGWGKDELYQFPKHLKSQLKNAGDGYYFWHKDWEGYSGPFKSLWVARVELFAYRMSWLLRL